MRVFIYEYLCGGGKPGHSLPFPELRTAGSLLVEGRAMLAAAVEDFARIPGMAVVTLLGQQARCSLAGDGWKGPARDGLEIRSVQPSTAAAAFRELAGQADYTLVIAPEFDNILLTLVRWVEEAGGRLLGPSAEAVRLTADKLTLGQHLEQHGIPTPPCRSSLTDQAASDVCFPAVWKPRCGAGSQATFFVRDAEELAACPLRACEEGFNGEAVIQPFVPGTPASVALLIGPARHITLRPAAQALSTDGRFRYEGGMIPLDPGLSRRASTLAERAAAAVPGLRGYVGVDLVLGEAADGSGDRVIEINPRLTTSYVGLRALARGNLADILLRIVQGLEVGEPAWRAGAVQFRTDGTVRETVGGH